MAQPTYVDHPVNRPGHGFDEFCDDVLGSLNRIDQRRAGKAYLYGLLNCLGRRSIRRMAAALPCGQSEQSLQQFVNQSPWDHEPIRRRLLHRLLDAGRPTAWVVDEIAFPKHGRYSAAVDRQYVRALEKVCNCQLSIVATLVSPACTAPVNWRLLVPESWRRDRERRVRARIPDHEHPRPYWRYQVEVLDDLALDWGMPPAPVVVDARPLARPEALFAALEARGLPYLAQVGPNLAVGIGPRYRRGPVGELVLRTGGVDRVTVPWSDGPGDRLLRAQFLQVPLRPDGTGAGTGPVHQQLIVEWPLDRPRPRGYWITNLTARALPDLVTLAKLPGQVGPRLEDFAVRFGLRDYEGRTFAGWHHHVTLATAAHVFHTLTTRRVEDVA